MALVLSACSVSGADDSSSNAELPDGELAVLRDIDGDDRGELYLMTADRQRSTRLAVGSGFGPPSWHPTGDLIAVSRDTQAGAEILILTADGSVVRTFGLPNLSLTDPVWSPDGEWLASVASGLYQPTSDPADSPAFTASMIVVIRADGTEWRYLIGGHDGSQQSPTWSPDGQRIAYAQNSQIWVAEIDGSPPRRVSQDVLLAQSPLWSPTSEQIAYVGFTDDNPAAYVVNSDGSGSRRFSSDAIAVTLSDWSSDGTRLVAVVREVPGSSGIAIIDIADTGVQTVVDQVGRSAAASWSPDGSWIAVASDQGDGEEVGPVHLQLLPVSDMASIAVLETTLTDLLGLSRPAWRPVRHGL